MFRFPLIAFALFAAGSAQAQVYKCVDAAGKVVYSRSPAANTKIRHHHAPSRRGALRAPGRTFGGKGREGDAARKPRPRLRRPGAGVPQANQEREKATRRPRRKPRGEAQGRQLPRCPRTPRPARYRRIARVNPQGERYYLDDAQIEQQKAAARADVGQFCN